jgi:hypothetical protein
MKASCENEKCENSSCYTHKENCHKASCQDENCHEQGLLKIANCAWMEVVKEKIKEHILATENARITELAKIIAEGNQELWKHKMGEKRHCKEFEEKLCGFFARSKK